MQQHVAGFFLFLHIFGNLLNCIMGLVILMMNGLLYEYVCMYVCMYVKGILLGPIGGYFLSAMCKQ